MDSSDISTVSSDLSSQQILVNQLKEKLQKNESLLKGRENEFHELQSKFNKLKFLHKSKASSATSAESSPTRTVAEHREVTGRRDSGGSETSATSDSAYRGKFLLLKKQLEESRALIQRQESENQSMKRELQELKDKQIKYEAETDDKDMEVIDRRETAGQHSIDDMFAQIVYKDTKIMEMNQKVCDLEAKIMDLQENLREHNEVLQARNRAIKVLLSQQQQGSSANFEQVVQREEQLERIEKLKERVAELEMEKGNLQLRVMELEGTNGSRPPMIDIEIERDQLNAERDELRVKFNELMAKYDSLELQNDRLTNEKEKVNSELKKAKDMNNNLTKDKERQNSEIERLNQTIAGIEKNYNAINNELIAMKAAIDDKDKEIQSARQQLSDLALKSKHVISEKESKIVELSQQLSLRADDSALAEKDRLIEELTRKLDNARNENWGVVNINEDLKEQCAQLEQRLASIESECQRLAAERADIEADRQRLSDELSRDVQSLSDENNELRSRLETSFTRLSEYEQKFVELTDKSDAQCSELISEIDSLKKTNRELEDSYSERVNQLENSIRSISEQLALVSDDKTSASEQLDSLRQELEEERLQKENALKTLREFETSVQSYGQVIGEKDESIRRLEEELSRCQLCIKDNEMKIQDLERDKEQSDNYIKQITTDLEDRIRAFDQLNARFEQTEKLLTEKSQLLDEMHEQRQEIERQFEEAKVKNQGMALQMESLIKLVEIESQEKDRLKQSLDNLQKENFEESDLIREKEHRIDILEKEIRKQVEDMREVEEALNEKTNEIETLTNDTQRLRDEKTELDNRVKELNTKLNVLSRESDEEILALKRDIEDLNEEIDYNKNEMKTLNDKLVEELRQRQRLESREEENVSTIQELSKQLESQQKELTEAMDQLMSKSGDNTDTNLLLNEIQGLRQTVSELQAQNQTLLTDSQTKVAQLDASVNEYKSLLDEARHQIDRLEAEKYSAVQETNQVNQVLESERHTQTLIATQNEELRQQIKDLEAVVAQSQLESESVANDRINQLNQTIDDLRKQNNELTASIAELDQLRQSAQEVQQTSSAQLDELRQKSETIENQKNELEEKVNSLQSTIDDISADRDRYQSAYDDLQKQTQELSLSVQNKDIELANFKKIEELSQKSGQEVSELSQRLAETQTTIQMLSEEKSRFEFAYNDLVHRYQELNHSVQTKTYEIENLKHLETSYKNLTDSVNNLKEEKNHLLNVLNEKQEFIDKQNTEKEKLIEERQDIERSLRESEHNVSQLNAQIQALSQVSATQTTAVPTAASDDLQQRVQELEQQLQESQHLYNETDSKLSEVEYELDILKKNYNLEMESLSGQVQERETLADKLQDRNDKLKKKIERLNQQVREFTQKEAFFKARLEESEGLIKYEQMQRESATDTRAHELQQQMKDLENNYQIEIMNLRADLSNLRTSEEQLRKKLMDYEQRQQTSGPQIEDSKREIVRLRSQVESLVNQLESERIEKRRIQELFESGGQSNDQINQLLAQMEEQRQQHIAQKQELELKCKKFAAKFKVKDREVNALEEKLRVAKENASKNVNEEELIDSAKRVEELVKKVDDLQFTASNLDSALQTERQKRRELELEKQTFWSRGSGNSDSGEPSTSSSSFSMLIDEGSANKSGLGSAKKLFARQLMRGPPNQRYFKIGIAVYLALLHLSVLYLCLF